MRLSGFASILVIAAMVLVAAIVLWDRAGEDPQAVRAGEAVQHDDLEVRLGVEAEQRGDLGPPRSLPSRADSARVSAEPDGVVPSGTHPFVLVRRRKVVTILDRPGGKPVAAIGEKTEFGSPTVLGVVKIKGPWLGVTTPALPNHRLGWLRLDRRKLALGWTDRSLHVDLSKRQATLKARSRELDTFPVTVGAPGTETPTGHFTVTDTFRGGLNPVYGCCAVAISAVQPNLPPGWPGGNRIAIHGNGTGQPLGSASSNGCLRAADEAVSNLVDQLDLGTPVFIYN